MNIDSYSSADAEPLLRVAEERLVRDRRTRKEVITNQAGACAFLAAAISLAAFAPWQRPLSVSTLLLVLFVWVLVERARFPVAEAWTYPTMLVFVPALFILPTPVVPLVVMTGSVLRRGPDLVRGRVRLSRIPILHRRRVVQHRPGARHRAGGRLSNSHGRSGPSIWPR